MKYLLFGNNVGGCGFGNQIRAFVGAFIWSKVLDREFITNNYWFTNYFNLPVKTSLNETYSTKLCLHDIDFLYQKVNFDSFNHELLEFGGGTETSLYIKENPFHRKGFQLLFHDKTYYSIIKESLHFLLKDVKNEIKKNYNFEYNTIQFRSFYDVGSQNNIYFDEFVNLFIDKYEKEVPVFVTSDDHSISSKIKEVLEKNGFNTFSSDLPFSHTAFNQSSNPLIDWYVMGKSRKIFSTGTSFAKTSSLVFDTPIYIFDKLNNFFGHMTEENFTSI